MQTFTQKQFNIPELKGISKRNIEEHIKLYAGYVKSANLIQDKIHDLKSNPETNSYAFGEINRRFGFEYNGMHNHEIYFSSLENGHAEQDSNSDLYKKITATWGSFEEWLNEFKLIAMTRGIGWAILYHDTNEDRLLNAWVDEQHLGQLQGCKPILALDMWEHSYVADYQPSGKKSYIEDYFANVNWKRIESNF